MRLYNKKQWTWQITRLQFLGIVLLTIYELVPAVFPMIGSIYSLAGVRVLISNQSNFSSSSLINLARTNFERAFAYRWIPSSSETYLKLAQAFMLQGSPQFAVATLERTYPLPIKRSTTSNNLAPMIETTEQPANMKVSEVDSEVVAQQMVKLGDEDIDQSQHMSALQWYKFATERAPELQSALSFRRSIAAVLAQNATASSLLLDARQVDKTLEIYPLTDTLKIDGFNLRWMTSVNEDVTYGTPLSYGTNEASAGIFWWSGEAIALLENQRAGNYLLRARVRHGEPAPIQMAIGVDRRPNEQISLTRNDNSWETIVAPVYLSKGLHTVSLWFLNDAFIAGKDRDAAVEWVELQAMP